MKFINAKPLVLKAQRGHYAVPAFNTNGASYDMTRAAFEAAEELKSPLILQEYEPNAEYRGFAYFVNHAKFLYEELGLTVPVALHLDHGKSFASTVRAMNAGFTSVMFDASHFPLQENIAQTRKVQEVAGSLGISVEAEVGYVKGNEPKRGKLVGRIPVPETPETPPAKTQVAEAIEFVRQTEVDMLAVAIGSTHGVFQKQTGLDFDLLKKLTAAVSVPLVMHGTGGINLEDLSRLAKSGMAKINFGESFRFNYINYFNQLTDEMEHLWHPWRIMREVKNRLKDDMKQLIFALGSEGKAG
jgi:ketose-bisphosphate aldolase